MYKKNKVEKRWIEFKPRKSNYIKKEENTSESSTGNWDYENKTSIEHEKVSTSAEI